MSYLVELRVARHKEHITSDSVLHHGFSCDTIVAESKEDPRNICLNNSIVNGPKAIEKVHDSLGNQNVD